jgi:hypothetical protein
VAFSGRGDGNGARPHSLPRASGAAAQRQLVRAHSAGHRWPAGDTSRRHPLRHKHHSSRLAECRLCVPRSGVSHLRVPGNIESRGWTAQACCRITPKEPRRSMQEELPAHVRLDGDIAVVPRRPPRRRLEPNSPGRTRPTDSPAMSFACREVQARPPRTAATSSRVIDDLIKVHHIVLPP